MLTACGNVDEEQNQKIEYAAYGLAELKTLVSEGERERAIEIIAGKEKLSLATGGDYLLAAQIYISVSNGVAAEVALEKMARLGDKDAEYFLVLAQAHILQTNYNKAEDAIIAGELKGKHVFQGLLLRGDIHKGQRKFKSARTLYKAAITDQPKNPLGYLGAAQVELIQGNLEAAADFASAATKLAPDNPIALYVQGAVFRYRFQTDKAIALLERSVALNNTQILPHLELVGIYTEAGAFEKARAHLDVVYAAAPQDRLAQFYTALMLAAEGKPNEAEEILVKLGDLPLTFPLAGRVYGHTLYRLGQFSKAQLHLERFLDVVPSDRPTRLALAEIYIRRGRGNKALATLQPLIGSGQNDIEAILQSAAAAALVGDKTLSGRYLSQAKTIVDATKVNEQRSGQHQEQGRKLARRLAINKLAQGKSEDAVAQLRDLLAVNGEDYTSLSLLSNVQMKTGDIRGAEKTALRMLELAPDNPLSSNLMGVVRYRQRDWSAAQAFYDRAIQLSPEYLSALKNRGVLFLALEQFEKARTDLEKVVIAMPGDSQSRGLYGRSLLEVGRTKEASEHLQAAERAFPRSVVIKSDYAEALEKLGYLSSAIAKLKEAQALVAVDSKFGQYLSTQYEDWLKVEAAREVAEELKRKDAKKLRDKDRVSRIKALEAEVAAETEKES